MAAGEGACPLRRVTDDDRAWFEDCIEGGCEWWYDVDRIKDGTVSTKENVKGCAILRALLRIGGIL